MAFKYVLLATVACSVPAALAAPQQGSAGRSFFPNVPAGGRGFLTPEQAATSVNRNNNQQQFVNPEQFLDLDITLNERASTTTVVPILRFVDTQNPDGSYTYGYENGDQTYKIETRYATGEVKGKYGYIDPTGLLREVEYGATPERGFEPSIDGLELPAPTEDAPVTQAPEPVQAAAPVRIISGGRGFLDSESTNESPRTFANFAPRDSSNGARSSNKNSNAARRVVIRKRPAARTQQAARPAAPVQSFRPAALPVQPVAAPLQPVAALPIDQHRFLGHPAQNINLQTGSYTFEYGK